MKKDRIKIHILNADGRLTRFLPQIERAIAKVRKRVDDELRIDWVVDLVITSGIDEACGPDGVGGIVIDKHQVIIDIDPDFSGENNNELLIYQIICHEFCHIAREDTSPRLESKTLFDEVLHEGLAIAYEEYIATKAEPVREFVRRIVETPDEDIVQLIKKLPPLETKCTEYNSLMIFGDGSDFDYKYGQWPGYHIGYYLAKQYLKKTGKSVVEVLGDKKISTPKRRAV